VLRNENGSLRFLVNADYRKIIQDNDLVYVEDALQDMRIRSKEDPEALFSQLSSLARGPLVTIETGLSLEDFHLLHENPAKFIDL
jgi:hypothetical protein